MNPAIEKAGAAGPVYQGTIRTQRDVIRDVMLAAADCGTWLSLDELHALTRFGEASISAQLRHLRKLGYRIEKRRGRGGHPIGCVRDATPWEYRLTKS